MRRFLPVLLLFAAPLLAWHPTDLDPGDPDQWHFVEGVRTFTNPITNDDCTGLYEPNWCCTGVDTGTCNDPVESFVLADCDTRNLDCTASEEPYPCCTGSGTGDCCYEQTDANDSGRGNKYCPAPGTGERYQPKDYPGVKAGTVCAWGCVNQWVDQSGDKGEANSHTITGRAWEQDDLEQPCYEVDCSTGLDKACARGRQEWAEYDYATEDQPHQSTTFEVEPDDREGIFTTSGDKCSESWYGATLARQYPQRGYYEGNPNNWYNIAGMGNLKYYPATDRIRFSPADLKPYLTLSGAGILQYLDGQWHLWEIWEDTSDVLHLAVDGVEISDESAANRTYGGTQLATMGFCGGKDCNDYGFKGDIALGLTICGDADVPTPSERENMFAYANDTYHIADRARGYLPKDCSFDMDDDGVWGEPEDCNVCDGTTTDVDGDGQNEDLIYVDCDNGDNDTGDGSPGNPYLTLDYAFLQADGPSVGEEDIVCFKNTCTPDNLVFSVNGKSTYKTRTRSGSEERDFRYPDEPFMLVGWDSDNDQIYPPVDNDDVAIMYGGAPGCIDFAMNRKTGSATTSIEIAHFMVKDYGTCWDYDITNASGTMKLGGSDAHAHDYYYIHDLQIDGTNRDVYGVGGTHQFNSAFDHSTPRYFALENLNILSQGGYFMRSNKNNPSGGGVGTAGPFRIQNISIHGMASNDQAGGSNLTLWKLWGWYNDIEIIDNYFNSNSAEWGALDRNENRVKVFSGSGCMQEIAIRNNHMVDFTTLAVYDGVSGSFCTDRDGGPTYVDSNIYIQTYDDPGSVSNGESTIDLDGCDSDTYTLKQMDITNNIFYHVQPLRGIVNSICGINQESWPSEYPGVRVWNNTMISSGGTEDIGAVLNLVCRQTSPIPFDVRNNIFESTDDWGVSVGCEDYPLTMDYNVYSSDSKFKVSGTEKTFAQWQALGFDANGKVCTPTYFGGLDLHLASTDTCAIDAGTSLISEFSVDKDGDSRAGLTWDIGADEYVGDYTLTGACCDSTCAITTDAACADWQGAGTTCTPDPCLPPEGPEPAGFAEGVSLTGVSKE